MKSFPIILAALCLFVSSAFAAEAKGGSHAGHDHPAAGPAMADPHAGHSHSKAEPTPEEAARSAAAKAISDARLKRLAVMWRELARGAGEPAALKKAGLTAADRQQMAPVVEPYYRARLAAQRHELQLAEVRKRIAEAADANRPPFADDLQQEKLLVRRGIEHGDFVRRARESIGAEALKLLEKHEPAILVAMRQNEEREARELEEQRTAGASAVTEARITALLGFLRETWSPDPVAGKARDAALKRSGLEAREAAGLSSLAQEYFGHKHTADLDRRALEDAKKRLEAAKLNGKTSGFEEKLVAHFAEAVGRFTTFRAGFEQRWGATLVGLFDKHAAQFEAVYATPSAEAAGAEAVPAAGPAPAPVKPEKAAPAPAKKNAVP